MPASPEHTRVNLTPRITANELAKYMVSTETGKLSIIRNAKQSTTATRTRYKDARAAVKGYLTHPNRDMAVLDRALESMDQIENDPSRSDFAKDDARKSQAALAAFSRMRNALGGFDYVVAPRRQPKLNLSGVEVSVTVDLLVERTRRRVDEVGGVLFRFTQAEDETPAATNKRREMGKYAATLVHMHVGANMSGDRQPHNDICIAADVQFEEAIAAPRTYAQRARNMESACMMIGAVWDQV